MNKFIKNIPIIISIIVLVIFVILIYFYFQKTYSNENLAFESSQSSLNENRNIAQHAGERDTSTNAFQKKETSSSSLFNKTEANIGIKWGYWLVIVFILLTLNILTLIVLLGVLRWKRAASDGMIAIIPNQVINDMKNLYSTQNKQAEWLNAHMQHIMQSLSQQTESVNILKKELILKEEEIYKYKSAGESKEKEKTISKVIKLHSFLRRLEQQVTTGGIKHDVALGFLKDELADLFEEFSITEINPVIGSSIKELPSEGFTTKDIIKVNNDNLHLTVAELIEPGYLFTSESGKQKVCKPALISINKLGG